MCVLTNVVGWYDLLSPQPLIAFQRFEIKANLKFPAGKGRFFGYFLLYQAFTSSLLPQFESLNIYNLESYIVQKEKYYC